VGATVEGNAGKFVTIADIDKPGVITHPGDPDEEFEGPSA
jgi:hypothetical protein